MTDPSIQPTEGPDPELNPPAFQAPPPAGQPQPLAGQYGQPPEGPVAYPPYGQPPPPPWQPGGSYSNAATPGSPRELTAVERTWGGAAHWSALVAAFVAMAFLGPLLVLLVKGNESPYIRAQAVEALNFQLSILIYGVVSFVLIFVLVGLLLLPAVGIMWLVLTIMGSVKSAKGEFHRYPLTIRMVS